MLYIAAVSRSRARLALSTLVVTAFALNGVSASAQPRPNSGTGVTVYANPNFTGQSASFRDDTPSLLPFSMNDKTSSIRIPDGETWEVCQDVDYGNQCQVLTSSVSDLRSMGWNDRISSLRRTNSGGFRGRRSGNGGPGANDDLGVTVYADSNFSGQRASFANDTPTVVPLGLNDKISSIQIPDGETWEVCQDVDYGSQCQQLSRSVSDLTSMGWNDRISSLRRTDNNRARDGGPGWGGRGWGANSNLAVTVYANPNFSGRRASFRDDTPRLPNGLNDTISSIQIPEGETWEICQDIDYGSQCQVLTTSVVDLRGMGWNDRVSSLRRTDNNNGFGDGRYRDRRSVGGNTSDVRQDLVFFDRPGFRGSSSLVESGDSALGLSARMGSVEIRGGGTWELCDESRQCATISQNVSDVSQLRLTGRITSARTVDNAQFRRNRGGGLR